MDEILPIRPSLKKREEKLKQVFEKGIKIWRHKRISHTDLHTALAVTKLPNVAISDVAEIVSGISEFAREINLKIHGYDQSYTVGISQWAPQVLTYLQHGIQKRDELLKGQFERQS